MPDPKRVEFVTRHFKDLQSIRFAPVPAAILLAPLAPPMTHMSRGAAWAVLLGFLFGAIGFYWWSTVAIKRRYGSVKVSSDEAQRRMMFHPAILGLFMIVVAVQSWFYFFDRRNYHWEVFALFTLLSRMLSTILDSTNPASRRVAWTIGLVALFGAGPLLNRVGDAATVILLAGAVWLSISIFDFLLLRRTFAEISASPSGGATEALTQYG
jgi:hypothetical protein